MWAYPTNPPQTSPPPPLPPGKLTLAGSSASFTWPELKSLFSAPDWHPEAHPPMPDIASHGRKPSVRACGYCHLPTGNGRPEHTRIAGLTVNYFVAQMKAFRDGTRRSAVAHRAPSDNMTNTAKAIQDDEIYAAARYFAALPAQSYTRVVEAATVPKAAITAWIFKFNPQGGTEELGERIVEGPDDFERFEMRDPAATYVAYAPVDSIAQGKHLAETWGFWRTLECSSCHGAGYKGKDDVPGLAGRNPTSLIRQLYDFKSGARKGGKSSEMEKVVKDMSNADMLALGAYLGTLAP